MATSTNTQSGTDSQSAPLNVPFHAPIITHNYTTAEAEAESRKGQDSNTSPTQPIRIKDGRRNSQGEILPSPTESWRPTFNRIQSWNAEDLKRKAYKLEMVNGEVGQGTGFTEGGEGTRKV